MSEPVLNLAEYESVMWRRLLANLAPGNVFLDVGAEDGHWSSPAAQVGARVFAFEGSVGPGLRDAAARDGFAIVEKIVLDPPAIGTLAPLATGREPVPATTVDEFVRGAGLDRVDFIKIDVEGYEVRVLAGAADTIARFRPALMVEVHYDGGWNGKPVAVADVAARLPGYRFEVTDYSATVGWGGAHVLAFPEASPRE